jgi:inhibitor of cysteine peptidase
MQKEIKKKAQTYGVIAVLLAVILGALCYNLGFVPQIPLVSALKTFSSEAELKSFLESNANRSQYVPFYGSLSAIQLWNPSLPPGAIGFVFSASPAPTGSMKEFASPAASTSDLYSASNQYSTTNIQVAGVDELDTVKTDGKYIYTVSGNTVFIVNASLPNAGVVSRIECDDFAPSGIFLSGDRLAILGSNYSLPVLMPFALGAYQTYVSQSQTYVRVYDVSNGTNPSLLRNFTMTGNYLDSRMIGKYIYLVATMPAYLVNNTVIHPTIYSNDSAKEIPATEIYYSNVPDAYLAYSTFVALNVQDASEKPTTMTIMMGQASNMYVSLNNTYVTFPSTHEETTICRIHMDNNNVTAMAQGEVPGQVLNQFSMDENGDHFRIATTIWTEEAINISSTNAPNSPTSSTIMMNVQSTNVYVLDMNLKIVGRLEKISVGENFHSARFVGDRCYLVTFQQTDPLFVVDLSNPASPKVLGNLTVSGYSDYLQPYDDNHLIGVGKETVGAESGYFAWYQGIKIAIFDVTNVSNPVQMWNVTIGDRGSDSPVLYDHKALLFDKQMDLLVIPVTVAKIDPSQYPNGVPDYAYGTQVWQGVYVYNITLADGLVLKGNITHAETPGLPPNTLFVNRALYIGNVLYTVSQGKIELNSLVDLSLLKEISLS